MPIAWGRILPSGRRKGNTPAPTVARDPPPPISTESKSFSTSIGDLPRLHTPEWQRQRQSSLSERPATHNPLNPTNPFTSLPPDLIFSILDHCDTISILCLRLASRNFYNTIGVPEAVLLDNNVFTRLVKRDIFRELCQKENDDTNVLPGPNLLCSACLTSHPHTLFTSAQVAAPSRHRRCRGMEQRLILCRHKVLSFDEARIVLHMGTACPDSDHTMPNTYSAHPQYLWREDGLRITTVYELCTHEREAPALSANEAFVVQLNNDPRAICPHMQIKDILLPSLIGQLRFEDGGSEDSFFRKIHRCTAVDCQTEFSFLWSRVGDQAQDTVYSLLVTRKLGHLHDPTDKQWVAQVQPLDIMWTWGRRTPSNVA